MCGAFNGNIVKAAVEYLNTQYSNFLKEPNSVRIVTVGKKATDYFSKRNYNLYAKHVIFLEIFTLVMHEPLLAIDR